MSNFDKPLGVMCLSGRHEDCRAICGCGCHSVKSSKWSAR